MESTDKVSFGLMGISIDPASTRQPLDQRAAKARITFPSGARLVLDKPVRVGYSSVNQNGKRSGAKSDHLDFEVLRLPLELPGEWVFIRNRR